MDSYNEFIDRILSERGQFGCENEYCERHHISPICCGGTNNEENLIDLYPKEHFIAHKLLATENPDNDKLIYSYHAAAFMSTSRQYRYIPTQEEIDDVKITFSNMLRNRYKDKTKHPSYGTHISEERKRIIGNANKGNSYCVGREISEETRKKIGDANRNPSSETREKMSLARKGKRLRSDNSNAKSVIRLSDGKRYSCMKDAAEDNGINYSTFKNMVHKRKDYDYE